jgi:hypothetical protein
MSPRGLANTKLPGPVLEDRPPEENAGDEVREVLDVEEAVVLERRVVGGRDVPNNVPGDPDRQGDQRPGQRANHTEARGLSRERGRDGQHEEQRDPLGQRHVLHEVRGEEVVERERPERCDRDREQEEDGRGEARDAPGWRPVAS